MNIEQLIQSLDFEMCDYFYHETSIENATNILEEGLLINVTNVVDNENVLYNTSLPLTKELVEEGFEDFLRTEASSSEIRKISAMVIIVSTKDSSKDIIGENEIYIEGTAYEGVVSPEYILGYIDLERLEFVSNPNAIYISSETPKYR